MLEIVVDHRNGTPMRIHQNEDEHFIILEGTAHLFTPGGIDEMFGTTAQGGGAFGEVRH